MADFSTKLEFLFATQGSEAVMGILNRLERSSYSAGQKLTKNIGGAFARIGQQAAESQEFIKIGAIRQSIQAYTQAEAGLKKLILRYGELDAAQKKAVGNDFANQIVKTSTSLDVARNSIERAITSTIKHVHASINSKDAAKLATETFNKLTGATTRMNTATKNVYASNSKLITTLGTGIGTVRNLGNAFKTISNNVANASQLFESGKINNSIKAYTKAEAGLRKLASTYNRLSDAKKQTLDPRFLRNILKTGEGLSSLRGKLEKAITAHIKLTHASISNADASAKAKDMFIQLTGASRRMSEATSKATNSASMLITTLGAGVGAVRNLGNAFKTVSNQTTSAGQLFESGQINNSIQAYAKAEAGIKRLVSTYNKLSSAKKKTLDPRFLGNIIKTGDTLQTLRGKLERAIAAHIKLTHASISTAEATKRAKDQFIQMTGAGKRMGQATAKVASTTNKMAFTLDAAIGKLIKYRLSYLLLRKVMEGFRSTIDIFSDVNYEMAQLEKVLDPTISSTKELKEAAFELGKEFSVGATQVLKAFNIWARVGLQQNEILEATRTTLIGVNAIGLNTVAMTEALTSVIFTYGIEVSNTLQYVNEWLRVQSKFPVAASDLANALKAVGSSAKELGVDLTELGGYVTAVNAITRKSGRAIGLSLKTIFARIPKDEAKKAFQEIGIAIKKSETQYRDLDDILDDLSAKWDILTDVQKTNIAQTVGGIRRYVDFLALMDGYSLKQQAIIEGTLATNEAMRASDIEIESFKKQLENLQVVASEVGEKFGESFSGPLLQLVDTLKIFLKVINDAPPVLKNSVKVLLVFASTLAGAKIAVAGFNLVKRLMFKNIAKTITGVTLETTSIKGLALAYEKAGISASVFSTSMRGLLASLGPISLAFSIIGTAVALWPNIFGKANESVTRFSRSVSDVADSLKQQYRALTNQNNIIETSTAKLKSLVSQYQSFKKTGESTEDVLKKIGVESETLASVNQDLSLSVLKIKNNLDDTTEAYAGLDIAVQKTIKNNKELMKLQRENFELERDIYNRTKDIRKQNLDDQINNAKKTRNAITTVSDQITSIFEGQKAFSERGIGEYFDFTSIVPFLTESTRKALYDMKNRVVNVGQAAKQLMLAELRTLLAESGAVNFGSLTDKQAKAVEDQLENLGKTFQLFFKEKGITKDTILSQEEGTALYKLIMNDFMKTIALLPTVAEENLKNLKESLFQFTKEGHIFSKEFADIINEIEDGSQFDFNIGSLEVLQNRLKKAQSTLGLAPQFVDNIKQMGTILGKSFSEVNKEIVSFYKSSATQAYKALQDVTLARKTAENELEVFIKNIESDDSLTADKKDDQIEAKQKGYRALIAILDKLIENHAGTKDAANRYLAIIKDIIGNSERLVEQQKSIKFYGDLTAVRYNNLATIYKALGKTDKEILELEKQKLDEQLKLEISAIEAGVAKDKELKKGDAIRKNMKAQYELMLKMEQVDLVETFKRIKKVSDQFESTLSTTFASVPEIMNEGYEKRKELTKEIAATEIELRAAIQDGEQKSIAELRNKVKELHQELDEFASLGYELKEIFGNIFGDIQGMYFKALADDFAKKITNISIGGKSLGDTVGEAITGAMTDVNVKYLSDLTSIDQWLIDEQRILYNDYLQELAKVYKTKVDDITPRLPAQSTNDPVQNLLKSLKITDEEGNILNAAQTDILNSQYTMLETANTILNVHSRYLKAIADDASPEGGIDVDVDRFGEALEAGGKYLLAIGGQIAAQKVGGGGTIAGIGGGLGTVFGLALGPAGSLLSGIGGVLGNVAGSFLGGLFDSKSEPAPVQIDFHSEQAIKENTRAIDANTSSLKELDASTINAPSTFFQPAFTTQGAATTRTVNITIYANDAVDVAEKIREIQENDYEVSLRTNRTSSRYDI